jgi:geranylgeranyl reductase family protein
VRRFDVAIVGAGPAGSSAAIFLARKGYSVALLDKSLFPRDKLCGDFLNPVNWEIFEKLGIDDKLLASEHEKVSSFRISTPTVEACIPLTSSNGQRAFGLGLRRSLLDNLLLKRAEREGATVRQGFRINSLCREDHGWILSESEDADGGAVRSRLLIAADGRNSWVAHRLALARQAENSGRHIAFQLHLRGCRRIGGEVQIHLFPGGYAGLVGLGGDMVNLCLTVDKEKARKTLTADALREKCLYKNLHLRETLQDTEIVGDMRSVYPVYFSPRRCCGDRFMLAGDAARVTEPITGEGVYFALKSGELAAEAIDLAFIKGDFSAQILSHYKRACQRAFSLRQRVNSIIRALIYRPSLVRPSIRLACKTSFPIGPLVHFVCQTSNPEFLPHRI